MANKAYSWLGNVDWLDLYRYQDLKDWLRALGIPWDLPKYHPPDKTTVVDALKDPNVVAYIANAHGDQNHAEVIPPPPDNNVDVAGDVKPAMEQRGAWPTKPMKFAFLIHSFGMNSEGANTWSYELRKNSYTGSVVIGIKQDGTTGRMSDAQWLTFQTLWCSVFFNLVKLGWTFDKAFRYTDWVFPDLSKFTVFAGDVNMNKDDLLTQ